jgi:hypothetical protein
MHLRNQPPVFVPTEVESEIENLSKAALMDMVWDYAVQITASAAESSLATHGASATGPAVDAAMNEFRARREVVLRHRWLAKEEENA